ncbi:MAG TPA: hypothetical protein VGF07_00145 [Stellaceae bacterium]
MKTDRRGRKGTRSDNSRRSAGSDPAGQIEASKARLAASRRISRQTDLLIRESQQTIERSRERLDLPKPADKD